MAKNHERDLPVRVIRGHELVERDETRGYSYDGRYRVVSYELSDSIKGFKVYKYTMARIENQPPIPPCITGCTSHLCNTAQRAMAAVPLQGVDPNVEMDQTLEVA